VSRAPSRRPKKAKERKRRSAAKTVLVLTNGKITEMTYLNGLKRWLDPAYCSVTVMFRDGDPEGILQTLASGRFPREGLAVYDEVWIVADHDGKDRASFLQGCERVSKDFGPIHGVISVPCFEVWLNAHYKPVHRYATQADAQRHYRALTSLDSKNQKLIPRDFPWGNFKEAVSNCAIPRGAYPKIDTQGTSPSTTMPHLLHSLGLVELPLP